MNPIPRQKLKELITKYGRSICDDPRRCEGLLRDFCGGYRREIFVLVNALKEGVVTDLLATHSQVSAGLLFPKLSQRLTDNLALSREAARWTVESWALALGLVSDSELAGHAGMQSFRPAHGKTAEPPDQKTTPSFDLIVSPGGDQQYKTIGAAIISASSGDRILVRPGVYREQIALDKPLEILAEGHAKEVVITHAKSPVLQVLTSKARLKGVTIQCQARQSEEVSVAVEIAAGELVMEDCDINAKVEVGVVVRGSKTHALFSRCKIHKARKGLVFTDNSSGIIEECDFQANSETAIEINDKSNPEFINCKISKNGSGVRVLKEGRGVFENCEISTSKSTNLEILDAGNPKVYRCKIHSGKKQGLLAHSRAQGFLEECEIFSNASVGVEIQDGANPSIMTTKIHDNWEGGMLVFDRGLGEFENCDVFTNAGAGVEIRQQGDPILKNCRIRDGKSGVFVHDEGQGVLEGCQVFGNVYAGVEIKVGGNPTLSNCKIFEGRGGGVYIYKGGMGLLQDCEIYSNEKAGPRKNCIIAKANPMATLSNMTRMAISLPVKRKNRGLKIYLKGCHNKTNSFFYLRRHHGTSSSDGGNMSV